MVQTFLEVFVKFSIIEYVVAVILWQHRYIQEVHVPTLNNVFVAFCTNEAAYPIFSSIGLYLGLLRTPIQQLYVCIVENEDLFIFPFAFICRK